MNYISEYMKLKSSTRLVVEGLGLAIIICLFCIGRHYRHIHIDKNQIAIIKDSSEIKHWMDKFNNEHSTVKSLLIEKQNLATAFYNVSKKLNIKPEDVKSETNVTSNFTFSSTMQTDTIYLPDSSKETVKYIDNKYVKAKLYKDVLDLKVYDNYTITSYMKREHFYSFSKAEFLDISTENPYVTITNLSDKRAKSYQPKVIIFPYVGVGYSPIKSIIYPSIGIGVSLYKLTYKIY